MALISIISPCYNEEKNLLELYDRLVNVFAALPEFNFELILVDDGSTDNSRQIYDHLTLIDARVKVLLFSRNFGSPQFAYHAGLKAALGDATILLDADLQDPPELIAEMLAWWQQEFFLVLPKRVAREEVYWRRVGYFLFYRILQYLSVLKIEPDVGDFCLLDRRVVDQILAMPETDIWLRGLRAWVGFDAKIITYQRPIRKHGQTSFSFFKYVRAAKTAIANFSDMPLEIISFLGIGSAFFTGIVGLIYLYLAFTTQAPRGFFTLLMAIFFFGTLQMLSLGVLAEYLIRTLREVKKRPNYVIKAILQKQPKSPNCPAGPNNKNEQN